MKDFTVGVTYKLKGHLEIAEESVDMNGFWFWNYLSIVRWLELLIEAEKLKFHLFGEKVRASIKNYIDMRVKNENQTSVVMYERFIRYFIFYEGKTHKLFTSIQNDKDVVLNTVNSVVQNVKCDGDV